MKSSVKFIIAIILILSSFNIEAQKTISANAILQTAYKKAVTENKNVFIIFHASWCGWCKKLDASMNDSLTKKYFEENYIVIHLTVLESPQNKKLENEGALELLTKYKGEEAGLPFFVITDKSKKVIGDSNAPDGNTGCPSKKIEVDYFISLLKKSSKINPAGLEIIRTRFRKNDL
jgi:thioredoxin-related protein